MWFLVYGVLMNENQKLCDKVELNRINFTNVVIFNNKNV